MGDLTVNGFIKLIERIKDFIPSFAPITYFINTFEEECEDKF